MREHFTNKKISDTYSSTKYKYCLNGDNSSLKLWINRKNKLKQKLRPLFRKAIQTNTFINIDMEQYQYKDLSLEVFKELLFETEFKTYPHFGIVIQAYLKDSLKDLRSLYSTFKNRPQPITVRLVKGAYWDSENIQARQNNWPCPVYLHKAETDLNFEACTELLIKAHPHMKTAIGSHNIRSISKALSLVEQLSIPKKDIEIQALYGMAKSLTKALSQDGWKVRLYCPIGTAIPGMAYLVRRLLENTANESFIQSWKKTKNETFSLLKKPSTTVKDFTSTTKQNTPDKKFQNTALMEFSLSYFNRNDNSYFSNRQYRPY